MLPILNYNRPSLKPNLSLVKVGKIQTFLQSTLLYRQSLLMQWRTTANQNLLIFSIKISVNLSVILEIKAKVNLGANNTICRVTSLSVQYHCVTNSVNVIS